MSQQQTVIDAQAISQEMEWRKEMVKWARLMDWLMKKQSLYCSCNDFASKHWFVPLRKKTKVVNVVVAAAVVAAACVDLVEVVATAVLIAEFVCYLAKKNVDQTNRL